jgi:hypothetical protein
LFKIAPSFSINFLEIFLTLSYFPGDNSILVVILMLENKLQCGPPISGIEADAGPTCRCHRPTWLPPVTASLFARVLKRSSMPDRAALASPSSTPVSRRPAAVCSGRRRSLSPSPISHNSTSEPSSVVGYCHRWSTFPMLAASCPCPVPLSHPRAPP